MPSDVYDQNKTDMLNANLLRRRLMCVIVEYTIACLMLIIHDLHPFSQDRSSSLLDLFS